MLEAATLRVEYCENPLGIGEKRPRFSWIVDSDGTNVIQAAYRIQVSVGSGFERPLWDTGAVKNRQSIHVRYEGPALESAVRYLWRVRITDARGEESPWSETAFFETAILDPSIWKARFISAGDTPESSRGMRLRKSFTLKGPVASARLYATALGMYELSLNGKRVGDALFTPGWTSYDKRLQYQTYDVTGLVKPGKNAAGATLGCGWYKGDLVGWKSGRGLYGKRTALFFQLHIRFADGSGQTVISDESWRAAEGPILYSELYNGETYDARLEVPGWDEPGFDDSAWRMAEILGRDASTLVPQSGPFVRRQETIAPASFFVTPKGEKVLDFGVNIAGWVRFSVRGRAGDRVVLRHAEVLDREGSFYTANLRGAKARIEYILKGGGEETFEPHFTWQGFRYAMIEEYPGEPAPHDFDAIVIHSDMRPTGSFACSHELLTALHSNISRSLKGNFIDVPTDCPQRDERLGWTGDAEVFAPTACFHVEAAPLLSKWLMDLSADQMKDGGVPFVVPDVLTTLTMNDPMIRGAHSSCGWGDAAVIVPWTLYECYGDMGVLERQYDSMKRWVEYIRAHAEDDVLWNSGFHFGDWVALDAKEGSYFGATPNDLTATAYYAHSTDLLARAAAALGKKTDAKEYRTLHARITKAFREEFYTPRGRLSARTQTAHALALRFGLAPDTHRTRTARTLMELIAENGGHLTTGFLGTPHICAALGDNGLLDEAYALLLKEDFPSWLYQVKKGATTIWEHWDGIKPDGSMWSPDMNSFNHYAYGAIGDWLYRVVAGLAPDPDDPGYSHIIVHPRPGGGISWARARLGTLFGAVSIEWRIESSLMRVEVIVPHNTTAHVILPGAAPDSVGGNAPACTQCSEGADVEVGSGSWNFVFPV